MLWFKHSLNLYEPVKQRNSVLHLCYVLLLPCLSGELFQSTIVVPKGSLVINQTWWHFDISLIRFSCHFSIQGLETFLCGEVEGESMKGEVTSDSHKKR